MRRYRLRSFFLLAVLITAIGSISLIQYTVTAQVVVHNSVGVNSFLDTEEVYVPAGSFGMGCTHDLAHATCDLDAMPLRLVYLDAYYIDKVPVTNEQYVACESAGACPPPLSKASHTRPSYYGNPTYNSYPMINVEWRHANAYCRWVGKRLPTEAEWEKAARGTDLRTFPWGNELPSCALSNVGVLDPNNAISDGFPRLCRGDTTPVGRYPQNASPYGALDMVGNVREWVNDFYIKPYMLQSLYYNPTGPSTDQGKGRPVRGAGWYDYPRRATTWVRHDEAEAAAYDAIGFRCARSAGLSGTPTPTPTSTPTPTPTPFAAAAIGAEGGMVWLSYPAHLTLLQVLPDVLSATTTFTLTYGGRLDVQGDLQGLNHFFILDINPVQNVDYPMHLTLGYHETRGVIRDTIKLHRLEGNTWVTSGITVIGQSTLQMGHSLVWIKDPGIYGLLGQTNRYYLPILFRY